jgi:hypothetical protein
MEVLAMRLHARERWKLRQIEEALRKDDPGLDTLLAGRPPGRLAGSVRQAGVLAGYLVPPALLIAGLLLHATWLIMTGAALCPFIPLLAWLPIRRHVIQRRPGHSRKP